MKKDRLDYLDGVLRKILWKTWEFYDGKWKQSLIDIYVDASPIARDIGTTKGFVRTWVKKIAKEIYNNKIKIDFEKLDRKKKYYKFYMY